MLSFILKRIESFFFRIINYVSFGAIRLRRSSSSRQSSSSRTISIEAKRSASNCSDGSSSDTDTETYSNFDFDSNSECSVNSRNFKIQSKRLNSQSQNQEVINTKLKNKLDTIANSAVSHSYEDITNPNYHNFLWLSSPWDRSNLSTAHYFLPNWFQYFNDLCKNHTENSVPVSESSVPASAAPILTSKLLDAPTISSTKSTSNYTFTFKKLPCRSFLNFLHQMSRLPDSFFPKRRISVPKRLLKTLVIDLDETMIHSTANTANTNTNNNNSHNNNENTHNTLSKFDFLVEVLINRTSCLYYVYKRPHLDYFLDVVSNWYNLVVYTASVREYADPVIDLIDNHRRYFKNRFFRSSCSDQFFKDLSLVDEDLSRVCMLDNSAASFALYPDNAIPIESWREGASDEGLLELLPFLDALRFVDDVRSVLSLRRLINYIS